MYGEKQKDSATRNQIAEPRLMTKCKEIITDYATRIAENNKPENKKIISAYNQIIIQIIKGILDLYDEQLRSHTKTLYPLLCELITCDQSKDLRTLLRKVMFRIGQLHALI